MTRWYLVPSEPSGPMVASGAAEGGDPSSDEELVERMARVIGYHLAALVSGNRMPHMSGDPRNRLPSHILRRFDDQCAEAARAILSLFTEAGDE